MSECTCLERLERAIQCHIDSLPFVSDTMLDFIEILRDAKNAAPQERRPQDRVYALPGEVVTTASELDALEARLISKDPMVVMLAGAEAADAIRELRARVDAMPPYYCKNCGCANCGNTIAVDALSRAVAERDALRAEVEALREDARRYRWLRGGAKLDIEREANDAPLLVHSFDINDAPKWDSMIDAAIDVAMGR